MPITQLLALLRPGRYLARGHYSPKKFKGYGETVDLPSDNFEGYNAHAPNNDLGVITPTAALSAFPVYT